MEDAVKKALEKAGGDIRTWLKLSWEREKDKHEKAEAKLEVTEKEIL